MTPSFHQLNHGQMAYQWSHDPCTNPLVVLHGLGDSAINTYAPRFANTVLKDTPALFIDFPGFGEGSADIHYPASIEAMATDVATLLGELHVHSTTVFAHSMGANVALILAEDNPQLVSQLVLAEPLLQREQSVLAAGIAKHSEESFVARGYKMLVRATSLQAHRGDVAAMAFLPTLRMANPTTLYRSAVSLLIAREPGFPTLLQNQKQHTTLLIGGKSEASTANIEIDGIRVKIVPSAGHFMMVEQADATACAILNLVNGRIMREFRNG